MADSADRSEKTAGSGSGSWWGPWISSAKERTSTVFEAVKKDLDELSIAVRNEASNIGAAIEGSLSFDEDTSAVGTVKKSISSFFGQVSEVLIPSLEDEEVEAVLITQNGYITLTGFSKHLADLQAKEQTYLEAPDSKLGDNYKRWMEVIEQDQFTQDRLAKHLANSEILKEKYMSLVPDKVSHMEFWQRYLFKRALLEDAIANAEIADRRAKSELNSNKTTSPRKTFVETEQPKLSYTEEVETAKEVEAAKENNDTENEIDQDDIKWDNEELKFSIKLTEEEQIRLLEEYEQEIQERGCGKKNIKSENNIGEDIKQVKSNMTDNTNLQQNHEKLNTKNGKPVTNKMPSKKNDKSQKNFNKGKVLQNVVPAEKSQKEREESSSTSDESWEKDFDLN